MSERYMPSPLPMPDIPRLRKLVEWVEEQDALDDSERDWDQSDWLGGSAWREALRATALGVFRSVDISDVAFDCGTKSCVCGRLAIESGASMVMQDRILTFDDMTPLEYGMEALGLTVSEAEGLFAGYNTAAEVRDVAERVAKRVGERL